MLDSCSFSDSSEQGFYSKNVKLQSSIVAHIIRICGCILIQYLITSEFHPQPNRCIKLNPFLLFFVKLWNFKYSKMHQNYFCRLDFLVDFKSSLFRACFLFTLRILTFFKLDLQFISSFSLVHTNYWNLQGHLTYFQFLEKSLFQYWLERHPAYQISSFVEISVKCQSYVIISTLTLSQCPYCIRLIVFLLYTLT